MFCFFHQIAPPGPIRGTLGQFQFFLKIHEEIRQKVGSALYDTGTPRNSYSAVYHTPRNYDSAVNSAVNLTSLKEHMCTYLTTRM